MPARPGSGLVFIQPNVALLGLKLGFDAPPGASHVSEGFQGSVLRSVGQVVAGFAAIQVLTIDCPERFTRLPLPRHPNPLSAEAVDTRPLASLRQLYLPPRFFRQGLAALGYGLPLLTQRLGFARLPPSLIGRLAPASPALTPSWNDTDAGLLAHPPPHIAQYPQSTPPADTAVCPPTPVPVPRVRSHVGQKHPSLAVGYLTQRPTILPSHSHRLHPLARSSQEILIHGKVCNGEIAANPSL